MPHIPPINLLLLAIQKSLSLNEKYWRFYFLSSGEWTTRQKKKKKRQKSNRTRQKNKRGDSKVESNDSPEIPDRGEIPDIPG